MSKLIISLLPCINNLFLTLFLFNEILPQDLGFVDRSIPGNELLLEVDFLVGKKQLKQILEKVINTHGATKTAEVLDAIKAMGYKYSTRAAMTVSISDMIVPPQKNLPSPLFPGLSWVR